MTFHFANTLYMINQEIITTPKLNKNPRDRLIFVAREHFDSPTAIFFPYFRESSEVFISLRVSKVCWDDAMFLRETQLISWTWCSSGARQARFTHISVPSTHDKEQQHQLLPQNLGFEKLEVFQWLLEGYQHLVPDLLRCNYIIIQRKGLESMGLCEISLPILCPAAFETFPLIYYQRAAPGSLQTVLLSQQSVLQRAVSETKLPWIRYKLLYCTNFSLKGSLS